MLDLETIERDRAARRAYWRERGVYADYLYGDAFRDGVEKFGDTRLVFHSKVRPVTTTVREAYDQTERLASAFHHLGLKVGDKIAVMLPTWHDADLAYMAGLKLGLCVIPIVAIYGAREIGFIVRQTGAKALIVPTSWRGFDYVQRVAEAGEMPSLKHLIYIGEGLPAGSINWDDLLANTTTDYPKPSGIADDVCVIIYTSGTTSDPKGVKHTHNTMLCDANAARANPADVPMMPDITGPALSVFPAGHIAGFLGQLRPFTGGGDAVFMDQWIPEDGAKLIEQYKIASTVGTPIFLSTLMKAAEETGADISSLKRFGLGASAITPENIRWTDKLGFPSGRTYGMTEHTVISTGGSGEFEKRAFTDGQITVRNEVRILDEEDHDVPVGEEGEIASRGPRLFMGYVDQSLDQACFLPGGWFKTGDIGRLDAENYLTITDRKKDIIIRGGENISSKEVEDILSSMPNVIESAVTAMPDPVMGERVAAFIVPVAGKEITLAEITQHFRTLGITRQKTPEKVVVVDELPRTPSGKVKKVELRAQLKAEA
jgi:acyl-coenzyme A synthetase/AMP-(fatty) acid ligase